MSQALAPWAAELDGLHPACVAILGPLLPRLDRFLGLAFGADAQAAGDPDGLDGLSRRGPPERLLLSEWALALEAPDEFLRRAAVGELLYAARAHRGVAPPPRTMVLLLDGGPNSLGAPRLAQLALVIAVVRRARERGAKLAIGSIAHPDIGLYEGEGPERLRRVLAMRTRSLPALNAAERWMAKLGREAVQGLWVVGERGPDAPRGWSTLGVSEPPDGDEALQLALSRDGRPLGQLRLRGLDDDARARLLLDPFQPESVPKPPSPGARPEVLRFVARGDYLLGQIRQGELRAWHVRAPVAFRRSSTRRLPFNESGSLLATGWAWRHIHAITLHEDTLIHWRNGGQPSRISLKGLPLQPAPSLNPQPLFGGGALNPASPQRALYFLDGLGQLWRLSVDFNPPRLVRYREPVSALGEDAETGPCVVVHDVTIRVVRSFNGDDFDAVVPGAALNTLRTSTPAWLGGRASHWGNLPLSECAAAMPAPGILQIWHKHAQPAKLQFDPSLIPIGISVTSDASAAQQVFLLMDVVKPAIVALREDGTLHPFQALAALPRAIAVSPGTPAVAWIGADNRLHIRERCGEPVRVRSLEEL